MMGIIQRSPSPDSQPPKDETAVREDAVEKEVQDLRVSPAPELNCNVQDRVFTQPIYRLALPY